VRDFVHIEPPEVSGIVEQFGLRTTLMRSLNGDRTYVPNLQIIQRTCWTAPPNTIARV
jgi:small-conductance mechanosensitive channel